MTSTTPYTGKPGPKAKYEVEIYEVKRDRLAVVRSRWVSSYEWYLLRADKDVKRVNDGKPTTYGNEDVVVEHGKEKSVWKAKRVARRAMKKAISEDFDKIMLMGNKGRVASFTDLDIR